MHENSNKLQDDLMTKPPNTPPRSYTQTVRDRECFCFREHKTHAPPTPANLPKAQTLCPLLSTIFS